MHRGAHFLLQIATLTPCLVIAREREEKGKDFLLVCLDIKRKREKKRKENTYVWLAKRGEIERKVYIFLLIFPHKIDREKNNGRNVIIKHEKSNMSGPTFLDEVFLFISTQNRRIVKFGPI